MHAVALARCGLLGTGHEYSFGPPAHALLHAYRLDALLLLLQDPRRQGDRRGAEKWCVRPAAYSRRLLTQPNSRHAADLAIRGTLHSVDQFLNIKLLNVAVEDTANFPHMVRLPACPLCDESSPTLLDARMRPSRMPTCVPAAGVRSNR